jgi:hypothetical protein
MVSDPLSRPVAVGLNVTLMVQLAPAARLVPQLLLSAKLAEPVMPLTVNVPPPELDSVTV